MWNVNWYYKEGFKWDDMIHVYFVLYRDDHNSFPEAGVAPTRLRKMVSVNQFDRCCRSCRLYNSHLQRQVINSAYLINRFKNKKHPSSLSPLLPTTGVLDASASDEGVVEATATLCSHHHQQRRKPCISRDPRGAGEGTI